MYVHNHPEFPPFGPGSLFRGHDIPLARRYPVSMRDSHCVCLSAGIVCASQRTESMLAGRRLMQLQVTWASHNMTRAMRLLLATAIQDTDNQKFIFVVRNSALPLLLDDAYLAWVSTLMLAPLLEFQLRVGSQP